MRLDGDFLIYDQIASAPGQTPDYALVAILTKEKPGLPAPAPAPTK
jgi:hypothetical protein